jgi:hypothetical protein
MPAALAGAGAVAVSGGAMAQEGYTTEDMDKVIEFCRGNPGDPDCQTIIESCRQNPNPTDQLGAYICPRLVGGGGGAGGGGGGGFLPPGGGGGMGVAQQQPKKPAPGAGLVAINFRLGFVDEALLYKGAKNTYSAAIESTLFSFDGPAIGVNLQADLGSTSEGGFLYRAGLVAGVGKWLTPHIGLGVMGGAGIDGVTSGVPFALYVPARAQAIVHAGDKITLSLWGQPEWYFLTEDVRQDGSKSLDFADGLQAGATLVWGDRYPANGKMTMGWSLGGVYQELNGTTIMSVVVGFGAAQHAWNEL